ncbi:hypothetical protein SP15_077 [Bacillus phage SP-15]|uniref:Uncharacterized protein n=1 Tax=Bacillus phage SP-15 TaxID=1792032 RepID=A0A127AW19_9CAUD|nr:hypothetical protein SP15_077 [Bacillus phage SP-15]AMM44876.1 hypothetical protein SP15_077 [Bacillus phage SP-15]
MEIKEVLEGGIVELARPLKVGDHTFAKGVKFKSEPYQNDYLLSPVSTKTVRKFKELKIEFIQVNPFDKSSEFYHPLQIPKTA